jgi:hypothetical protein
MEFADRVRLLELADDPMVEEVDEGLGVALDRPLKAYAERIWNLPAMAEWREAALAEREEIEELEVEF